MTTFGWNKLILLLLFISRLLLSVCYNLENIQLLSNLFMWSLVLLPLLSNAFELRAVKTEIRQNLPHTLRQIDQQKLNETTLKPGQHWFQTDEEGRVTVPWTVTGRFEIIWNLAKMNKSHDHKIPEQILNLLIKSSVTFCCWPYISNPLVWKPRIRKYCKDWICNENIGARCRVHAISICWQRDVEYD